MHPKKKTPKKKTPKKKTPKKKTPKKKTPRLYCGNNRRHRSVLSGEKRIGSRYLCLKNGIGVGLSLPYDSDYEDDYDPIDDRKYYCGDRSSSPEGYDAMGSNAICHRIGVGVGKRLKAKRRNRSR